MAKKPDLDGTLKELGTYQTHLQIEMDELEEKHSEEMTESAQNKLDELQARIDLIDIAISSIEDLE